MSEKRKSGGSVLHANVHLQLEVRGVCVPSLFLSNFKESLKDLAQGP